MKSPTVQRLADALVSEGSARYVADPATIPSLPAPTQERADPTASVHFRTHPE
ncbi:MAG: hypothetical protein ACLQUY_10300 [Ktedonobacterales bacterium]